MPCGRPLTIEAAEEIVHRPVLPPVAGTRTTVVVGLVGLAFVLGLGRDARADLGPWHCLCGTILPSAEVSEFTATPDGPPRLVFAASQRMHTTRSDRRLAALGMDKPTCESVARWVNDRCRNNLDSRVETRQDGQVELVQALAPWVVVHWAECAAINMLPPLFPGDTLGGQYLCQTLDHVPPQKRR